MEEQQRTTGNKGIIIFLIIIILVVGGYLVNDKLIEPYYFNQGAEAGALTVVQTINQNGQIPVVSDGIIQWTDIRVICNSQR